MATAGAPALSKAPAPDFEHPLEMLAACHERIEDRCDLLHRLVEHLGTHGCDSQAREAAASVLRYFDTAGEHHHQDEEQDLFPRLVATQAPDAAALVRRLLAEHEEMRAAWGVLRVPLEALARGVAAAPERAAVERFTALHRAHIEREEAELLPLAARVLAPQTLDEIGAAMAQRRGVPR